MELGVVRESVTWPRWAEWEVESAAVVSDLVMLPLSALFFPLVRFCLDKLFFEKLGSRFITGYAVSLKLSADETEADREKLVKFKEYSWKCVHYLTAEILALVVTCDEPWFTTTKYFWRRPGDRRWPDQLTKVKLKGLYGFAGGFYFVQRLRALILGDTAIRFWCQHVAPCCNIDADHLFLPCLVNFLARFFKWKLTKYSVLEIVPSISFILFAIIMACLAPHHLPLRDHKEYKCVDKSMVEGPVYYYVFNTLLITLLVMHIYWWILIWCLIMRQVQDRGKISDDVRSDSGSVSDSDVEGKNKVD